MDNTFNQAFKPITNTKSIKEYESEIDTLKNEVFELKSRIAQVSRNSHQTMAGQSDINQLLLDSKRSIDLLERENIKLNSELVSIKKNKIISNEDETNRMYEYKQRLNEEWDLKCNRVILERDNIKKEFEMLREHVEKSNFTDRINNLENEKNDLLDELKRKEAEYENNTDRIKRENRELLENSANELNLYRSEIIKHKESINWHQGSHNEMKNRINELENELKKMVHENNLRLQEIEHYKKNQNAAHEAYRNLEISNNNCNELRESALKLQNDIKVISKQNIELKNKLVSTEQELFAVRKGGCIVNNDVDQLKEKLQLTFREVEDLRSQLSLKDTEKTELVKRVEILVTKNKEIYDKYNNSKAILHNEKENTQQNNNKIEAKVNYLNQKVIHYKQKEQNNIYLYNKLYSECKNYLVEYNSLLARYQNNINRIKYNLRGLSTKLKDRNKINDERITVLCNIDRILDRENLNFVKENFPYECEINSVMLKIKRIFNKMTERINVLENDTKQLTLFAEKSAKNQNLQTEKLIDDFIMEFKNAKIELEFCKTYIKEKSRAIKEMKTERLKNHDKIKELESKIESSKPKEKRSSFFSRLY